VDSTEERLATARVDALPAGGFFLPGPLRRGGRGPGGTLGWIEFVMRTGATRHFEVETGKWNCFLELFQAVRDLVPSSSEAVRHPRPIEDRFDLGDLALANSEQLEQRAAGWSYGLFDHG